MNYFAAIKILEILLPQSGFELPKIFKIKRITIPPLRILAALIGKTFLVILAARER
ncbi:hypothetical protein MM236_14195 [Belliella sp. DSM 107340]|uniref:Uncharacterized protein n=1 Tax=Belliella calami TaxID=2923436 RepID=A0ABS9URB3_9BACT|nr:hypothetical protein [Belliella calami]